jgi:hypothetical protein
MGRLSRADPSDEEKSVALALLPQDLCGAGRCGQWGEMPHRRKQAVLGSSR